MSSLESNSLIDYVNNKFLETLEKFSLLEKNDRVLIGLSGGADSVLLTNLFYSIKESFSLQLFLCHINHMLRGDESDRDEAFCKSLAERLSIPFFSFRVNVREFAFNNKLSIEEAARVLRYKKFEEVIKDFKINRLATAHNLDDLFETILYRILKGCGGSGLVGIPIKKSFFSPEYDLIRPLLFIEKKKIESYIKIKKMDFVFDSSNMDTGYSRNFIRKRIVPLIEERFPLFREKIEDFYKIIWEEEKFWSEKMKGYSTFLISDKGYRIKKAFFDLSPPLALKRRLVRYVVSEVAGNEFYLPLRVIDKVIEEYSTNGTKSLYLSSKLNIYTSYGDLIFEAGQERLKEADFIFEIDSEERCFEINNFRFKFYVALKNEVKIKDFKSCMNKVFFNMDFSDKIFLRNVKKGDRIEIDTGKTKKLSDVFIDSRISRLDRGNALVVTNEHQVIALVFIPFKFARVSKRFYVTDETRRVGILEISKD
ncbi:MAG: tRNA lysidine(34) synthetase TilS [Brevinematia bacterium]